MGNRFTDPKDVFAPRGTPTTTVVFPPADLKRFKEAAQAELQPLSRWLHSAASAWMAGNRERAKAARAAADAKAKAAATAKTKPKT